MNATVDEKRLPKTEAREEDTSNDGADTAPCIVKTKAKSMRDLFTSASLKRRQTIELTKGCAGHDHANCQASPPLEILGRNGCHCGKYNAKRDALHDAL